MPLAPRTLVRIARIVSLAAFAALAAPGRGEAVNLLWQNGAGGFAGAAVNWNPAQVPAEADLLQFSLAAAYTVTFGANVDSVSGQAFYGGDVTLNFNVTHGLRTDFTVAPGVSQVATARITAGTLRLGTNVNVGSGPGAVGTLRVNGATTNALQNGTGTTPEMNIGGSSTAGGTGEVVVLGGGALELADDLNLARHGGSTGTLRVKGLGDTGAGLRRSHFFADAATADCRVGRGGAHGILEVTEGGLFRIGRDLRVAEEAGDLADVTIGGENLIDSSEVRVKDDLRLCVNPSTLAGQAGGAGTIVLDSLGVLVVDDSTVVGDPDGSTGTIVLRPHSRMITKHLILQQPSGGAVSFEGGLLQVNGGTLSTSTSRLELPGTIGSEAPTLELLDAATAAFTGTAFDPPLTICTTGSAQMKITGGALVTANGGGVVLAESAGSAGTLRVTEGGQITSDRAAELGPEGLAYLYVQGDGSATFAGLDLGAGTNGAGNVVLSTGGTLTSTGSFNIAGNVLAAGNSGRVDVTTGGTLNLNGPSGSVWPDGWLFVGGGAVNLAGTLVHRGLCTLQGGSIAGGTLALRGDGRLEGAGSVTSAIFGSPDTTVSIAATGDLEIGRDAAGGDVLMRGALDAAGFDVTVHDPDSAIVGIVSLAGGELHLPAGGGVIESGKRLSGYGTVHGTLVNRGHVIGSGGDLVFDGMLEGAGAGVSGSSLEFLGGGGFEGAGLVDAPIRAEAGSLMRATGALTLGRIGAGNTSTWLGRIETGPHTVTLRSHDFVGLSGEIVLGGGRVELEDAAGITPYSNGAIRGRGDVDAGVTLAGTLEPGFSAGRLAIHGTLVVTQGARLAIELGNHALGEHDTLAVSGLFYVSTGAKLELKRLATFAAAPGDSFHIVVSGLPGGAFDTVTLDGAPAAGLVDVHYRSDGIWVVILPGLVAVADEPPGAAPPTALRFAALASPGAHAGVELSLPRAAAVALAAFDVAGRQVARLHDGVLGAGVHRFELPREAGGPGVYLVRAVVNPDGAIEARTVRIVRLR